MAVTKKIVTNNFNVLNAKKFNESFSTGDDHYYLFAGKHLSYTAGDSIIDTPEDSVQTGLIDIYDNMVFTKAIANTDVLHMVKRNDWTTGTVYDEYLHDDPDLIDANFFVTVRESDEYNVYKCLFNNGGANSTVAPSRIGSAIDLEPIETGDGYIWKYMYTIPKATFNKFATTTLVPLTANADIIAGAVKGRIEVIKVEDGGARYNNYIANGAFIFGDIKIDGSPITYGAISGASATDNYYKGCVIRITSGSAIGEYRRIDSYSGSGDKKKFVLESEFDTTPAINDTYEVYPYVYVWGDGSETDYADGIAIVDSDSSNSISSVEVLKVGAGYRSGTAVVGKSPVDLPYTISSDKIVLPTIISSGLNFEEAELKPIISPGEGHGSDPYAELFANKICISVKLNQTESNTIPIQNDIRQIGIIRNPKFDNVEVTYDTNKLIKSFSIGETVKQYKKIKLFGDVSVNTSSNVVTKSALGKISTTVEILSAGNTYNNSVDFITVDNGGTNGTGFEAEFANNSNGGITSVTVTNQGSNYESAPSLSISSSTGSNGIILAALANPQVLSFGDSFAANDYIFIQKDRQTFLSRVSSVTSDNRIVCSNNSPITVDNAEISAFKFTAQGKISAIATGKLTLTDVIGSFSANSKIIGLTSGATTVANSVTVNDKTAGIFVTTMQLTRLIGDFASGTTPFVEDEYVYQSNTISEVKPFGYLHHAEIDSGFADDTLYISKTSGVFSIDPAGDYQITGNTSGAAITELTTKYNGDFVRESGQILYFENIDPITRNGNKSEIFKIILEF